MKVAVKRHRAAVRWGADDDGEEEEAAELSTRCVAQSTADLAGHFHAVLADADDALRLAGLHRADPAHCRRGKERAGRDTVCLYGATVGKTSGTCAERAAQACVRSGRGTDAAAKEDRMPAHLSSSSAESGKPSPQAAWRATKRRRGLGSLPRVRGATAATDSKRGPKLRG